MDRADRKIRQIAFLVLKVSVSSALIYLLISKIGGKLIFETFTSVSPEAFVAAVGLYFLSVYVSTLRWKVLIQRPVKARRLFSLYILGAFFNTLMPGIIGGDAVKAYYLSRDLRPPGDLSSGSLLSRGQRVMADPESFHVVSIASVFMDRYIGFAALMVINIAAFPFGITYLETTPLRWIMPLLIAGFFMSSLLIYKLRIGQRLRFLFRVYEYLGVYTARKEALVLAFLYSLVVQILGIVAVYVLSKGISLDISFLSLLIFLPMIILTSVLPISISGLGLREGAFVFLLGTMGVPSHVSLTLSLLWFLSTVVASLWGLMEYLRYKKALPKDEVNTAA